MGSHILSGPAISVKSEWLSPLDGGVGPLLAGTLARLPLSVAIIGVFARLVYAEQIGAVTLARSEKAAHLQAYPHRESLTGCVSSDS